MTTRLSNVDVISDLEESTFRGMVAGRMGTLEEVKVVSAAKSYQELCYKGEQRSGVVDGRGMEEDMGSRYENKLQYV